MQNPDDVLGIMESKAKKADYKFDRLYRNFYNAEFYKQAYAKIYAKPGNMTEGTNGKTIDGFNLNEVQHLIEAMKSESYEPNPVRRVLIAKKNSTKKRPLGIPAFYDKLVQEILRSILAAIYESNFSDMSHGFRPGKSCHTALLQVKKNFTGVKWWVEGDIEGFFDNINHHTLMNILKRRIEDEKFLRLVWKFLRAGYIYEKQLHNTYGGTPQGGIVSPILANIYLHELDSTIEKAIKEFDSKKRQRSANRQYKLLSERIENKKKLLKEPTAVEMEKMMDNFDPDYKRMKYVRYADDFLVGMIGSQEDAIAVKEFLTKYLKEELDLELSQAKTLITHNSEKVRFLGYDIFIAQSNHRVVAVNHMGTGQIIKKRTLTGGVKLSLPHDKLKEFMIGNGYAKDLGIGTWKAIHRPELLNNEPLEILRQCNAEFRGFYQYYKFAFDVREKLLNAHWLWVQSVTKTLAGKFKTKVSKLRNMEVEVEGKKLKRFYRNGNWGVAYTNKKGEDMFPHLIRREEIQFVKDIFHLEANINVMPQRGQYYGRTSIIQRLNANQCENCGDREGPFEVHHVRKLSDLSKKKHLASWEKFMIARNRKTIVLCGHRSANNCHLKLHNGKL
jgi:group II intron reverse transcriptase/maturase